MNRKNVIPLFTSSQIQHRVDELAVSIAGSFKDSELIVIGLLTGSFIFLADLMRALHHHGMILRVDFMTVSSYGSSTESSGVLEMKTKISIDIENKPVLLVDDILDSGRTLRFSTDYLNNKMPLSVKKCVLLNKPSRRKIEVDADFIGFEIDDNFVVGYGLDYEGKYRELPSISRLEFL